MMTPPPQLQKESKQKLDQPLLAIDEIFDLPFSREEAFKDITNKVFKKGLDIPPGPQDPIERLKSKRDSILLEEKRHKNMRATLASSEMAAAQLQSSVTPDADNKINGDQLKPKTRSSNRLNPSLKEKSGCELSVGDKTCSKSETASHRTKRLKSESITPPQSPVLRPKRKKSHSSDVEDCKSPKRKSKSPSSTSQSSSAKHSKHAKHERSHHERKAVEKTPKNEKAVEKAPKNEKAVEKAPKNEKAVEKAPKNEKAVEKAPKNEKAVEKAPKNEKAVEKAPKNEKAVEKAPKNEKAVEKAPKNEKAVEKAPKNEKAVEKAPKNEKAVEKPPKNEKAVVKTHKNEKGVEKTPKNEKAVVKTHKNEKAVEKTPKIEKAIEKTPKNEKAVEKTLKNEKAIEKTPKNEKAVEKTPKNEKAVEKPLKNEKEVVKPPKTEKAVEKTPKNEKEVVKPPKTEKAVEKTPKNEKAVEKTPKNEKAFEKTPKNEKTVEKTHKNEKAVEKTLKNEKAVEKTLKNEKAVEKTLKNEKAVEKTPKNEKDLLKDMRAKSTSISGKEAKQEASETSACAAAIPLASSLNPEMPELQTIRQKTVRKAIVLETAEEKSNALERYKIVKRDHFTDDNEPCGSEMALRKRVTAVAVVEKTRDISVPCESGTATLLTSNEIVGTIVKVEQIDDKEGTVDYFVQTGTLPPLPTLPTPKTCFKKISDYFDQKVVQEKSVPGQLMRLLSVLYLNTAKKLCVEYPHRCIDDLMYCSNMHYHCVAPPLLSNAMMANLRTSLKYDRFMTVANIVNTACYLGHFPASMELNVFSVLSELLLSVFATQTTSGECQIVYALIEDAFDHVVRCFPPCWLAMRPKYVQFLEQPIDPVRLTGSARSNLPKVPKKMFETLLDLLDVTMDKYSAAELGIRGEPNQTPMPSPRPRAATTGSMKPVDLQGSILSLDLNGAPVPITPRRRKHHRHSSNEHTAAASTSTVSRPVDKVVRRRGIMNLSALERESLLEHAFEGLPPRSRMERLMIVLRQVVQILEHDMAMWTMHHHKSTISWMFCKDNAPLTFVLFEFTQHGERMTMMVRRLFTIFATATRKGLPRNYLQILERYASLAVSTSNAIDLENTADGLRYPKVGAVTKQMIHTFYNIFKAHNIWSVNGFLDTIEILRLPYMRYEFVDKFLQIFDLSGLTPLTPQKIHDEVRRKHWLDFKSSRRMTSAEAREYLSREKYLKLLLVALRAYCEWHGTIECICEIINHAMLSGFKTFSNSVHHDPTDGTGTPLQLDEMEANVWRLVEQRMRHDDMKCPRAGLTIINVCVDREVLLKYRNDSKYMLLMYTHVRKRARASSDLDYSDWVELLRPLSKGPLKHCFKG